MKFLLLISITVLGFTAVAQQPPDKTQQQLENVAETLEDENPKDDNYLQLLEYYSRHSLNLNTATVEELQSLRLLTDLQIDQIILHRKLFGSFLSVYELQAVPSMDLVSLRKIAPYVFAGSAVSVKESLAARFRDGEHSLLGRIRRVMEKSKGYNNQLANGYLGDPNHLLFRYRYQYKNLLQYGLVANKDAGEQFFRGAQKHGFDFYSFHFFLRNMGRLKALALGDYLVNFGQGLIQWQSLAFGKSSEALSVKRQSPALMPYRSSGEFYFNRGLAATVGLGKTEATVFLSSKKISGNSVVDTAERFSGFYTSGYYRTPKEIEDRYNLHHLSFGGSLRYQLTGFRAAINTVYHRFSRPLQKRQEPYNYFAPTGQELWNHSADYGYTYKNLHLFGEAAVDQHLHAALVQGLTLSVDPKADLTFFYRSISEKYQSLFGNAFTENTLPGNEKGFYAGVILRPAYQWAVSGYADFFSFPFLKYRVHAPSSGRDYLVQINYQPNKQTEAYLRYRSKNKPVNLTAYSGAINYPVDVIRQSLRLHTNMAVSDHVEIKGRVEMLWLQAAANEQGFLAYAEAGYEGGGPVKGNFRLQYFETDSYNSRIYAYETDVLYAYSIPAFYDQGLRYYLNISFNFNKSTALWLRWAQTVYSGKQAMGSGLDEIAGSRKSDGKLQFIRRF